jgi:hypothetical protein
LEGTSGYYPGRSKEVLCSFVALHWLGNSFRMYLRNTAIIQNQHLDALHAASQEVMDLIAALPEDVNALCSITDESDNPDMHKYGDNMDQII